MTAEAKVPDGTLPFNAVRERWLAAGGKDTGGIVEWFAPPITEVWREEVVPARHVARLHLIGSEAGGRWDGATGGTYRIGDASAVPVDRSFNWDPEWVLVAVRDPEIGERVLIDGNERALQIHAGVESGTILADARFPILVGDLHLLMVRAAKAIYPLWR